MKSWTQLNSLHTIDCCLILFTQIYFVLCFLKLFQINIFMSDCIRKWFWIFYCSCKLDTPDWRTKGENGWVQHFRLWRLFSKLLIWRWWQWSRVTLFIVLWYMLVFMLFIINETKLQIIYLQYFHTILGLDINLTDILIRRHQKFPPSLHTCNNKTIEVTEVNNEDTNSVESSTLVTKF